MIDRPNFDAPSASALPSTPSPDAVGAMLANLLAASVDDCALDVTNISKQFASHARTGTMPHVDSMKRYAEVLGLAAVMMGELSRLLRKVAL